MTDRGLRLRASVDVGHPPRAVTNWLRNHRLGPQVVMQTICSVETNLSAPGSSGSGDAFGTKA